MENKMKKGIKTLLIAIIPLLVIITIIGLGFVVQFLWNNTISEIFEIKNITF